MKRTILRISVISLFLFSLFLVSGLPNPARLTKEKEDAFRWIDQNGGLITGLSDKIWQYAEVGMEEYQSSRLLADALAKEGFQV